MKSFSFSCRVHFGCKKQTIRFWKDASIVCLTQQINYFWNNWAVKLVIFSLIQICKKFLQQLIKVHPGKVSTTFSSLFLSKKNFSGMRDLNGCGLMYTRCCSHDYCWQNYCWHSRTLTAISHKSTFLVTEYTVYFLVCWTPVGKEV